MDSLTPAALVLAALLGAAGLAGLARFEVRAARIWAAAAILQVGLWIFLTALISRLPLMTESNAWGAVLGLGDGISWLAVDSNSWPVGTALLTLAAAVVLSRIVRIGENSRQDLAWVAVYSGLGLAACFAFSVPAVMISWASLDLAGAVYFFRNSQDEPFIRKSLARIVVNMVATTTIALTLTGWGSGESDFSVIPVGSSLVFLGAAALRLGGAVYRNTRVNFTSEAPASLLAWEMASVAGGLAMLVRVAVSGGAGVWAVPLTAAAALAGLFLAIRSLAGGGVHADAGGWVRGLGILAAASAVNGLAGAATAFSVVLLLGFGLIGIEGTGISRYRWLFFLMAVLVSGLPFSPAWGTAVLIETAPGAWGYVFAAAYACLLARFLTPAVGTDLEDQPVVPGVRSIYIGGLLLLVVGLVITGWAPLLIGDLNLESWWGGGLVILLTAGWLLIEERSGNRLRTVLLSRTWEAPTAWVQRLWRRGASATAFGLALLARLLEGEAAMLWALVLLSLIVSLFVQLQLGV
jgi:hypothetical protein